MPSLYEFRKTVRSFLHKEDQQVLDHLRRHGDVDMETRERAVHRASQLVKGIRAQQDPGLMEVFLAEYGLSTSEGVALMCLAEALLRVPDTETIDALIDDKITPSAWGKHLGKSNSSLVNASTWALMLTGKVLEDDEATANILRGTIRRLGEPVIRVAIKQAMKELGGQFVLGETISKAMERARKKQSQGYTFSYDMLGEAALTTKDASAYFSAYENAISSLSKSCQSDDIRLNPGISIKLSALHSRYEFGQADRVMDELVPRTITLAKQAKAGRMGLNIDAEEADRLDLSLDVIEAVLREPELAGWDGFGVVVQAYGKRALPVLEWLYQLASELDRKIMVRLVKGAYWDTEIKRAQVEGLSGFPVFSTKQATDVSYLCCAKRLLEMTDRIYPQFATHNAHSIATILEFGADPSAYEFQRLHGMGEALHDQVIASNQARSRIYAPVGAHRDLLAYLVRRLLENGANSSFVNQIVDLDVPVSKVAADPFLTLEERQTKIVLPCDLFQPERPNSKGFDLHDPVEIEYLNKIRNPFQKVVWQAEPILVRPPEGGSPNEIFNPAVKTDKVGHVVYATPADVEAALKAGKPWAAKAERRTHILSKAADLYEENAGEIFALLSREAGKTPRDAIAELREAVDFLRYYAVRGPQTDARARGLITCISPWNFPLAIFTGQIAAALAAGNGVLAKPAEQTNLIAHFAVRLLHQAGIPRTALQLLPGTGKDIGRNLTATKKVQGVCFTGSTSTAQTIHRAMASTVEPQAPLIAETGGLNAMIVDSTALPEQAIKDIITSAFQSAGQRCSALRLLYLQNDIAVSFLEMLFGAMEELVVGNPWHLNCDVGPIIDQPAQEKIATYVAAARFEGRVMKELEAPKHGIFIGPTAIKVNGIQDLEQEIFGPVLHVATYEAEEIEDVVKAINAKGYGLTFGMHTRIDDRVQLLSSKIKAGNIYVNRNQIGAIVGSQPFGGEGMSGTGPKAGGPNYVDRFFRSTRETRSLVDGKALTIEEIQKAIDTIVLPGKPLQTLTLPGPTGESNRLSEFGRGLILCLGPGQEAVLRQASIARANGCAALAVAPGLLPDDGLDGILDPTHLTRLKNFHAVVSFAQDDPLRALRKALAEREGAILPLFCEQDFGRWCRLERHVCVDITAAGGNASLLAEVS